MCILSHPGIPDDHPESYHTYMWQNFFQHIDIDPVNVHILNGNAKDLQGECDTYEKKIKDAGGVDLFVGGKADMQYIASVPSLAYRATDVYCTLGERDWE